MRQIHRDDSRAIERLPPEAVRGYILANSTPQDRGFEAEAGQYLRQLRDMAKLIGQITNLERWPEAPRGFEPDFKIANERFPAHQEAVGQHVPRSNLNLSRADQRSEPRGHRRTDFQVIVENDGLTVEMKERDFARLDQRNHPIRHRDQSRAHLLVGLIPLAIPMGMNNEVEMIHIRCPAPAVLRRSINPECDSSGTGF